MLGTNSTFIVCSIFAGLFHFSFYIWDAVCKRVCWWPSFLHFFFFASPFCLSSSSPSLSLSLCVWFFFCANHHSKCFVHAHWTARRKRKKNYFIKRKRKNAKNYEGRLAMWEVVRWCVRCDGLNIIFDLFFLRSRHCCWYYRALFPLSHSRSLCVSSLIVVLRISRACFILKYNFEQILCFFFSISLSLSPNFTSHF